jgi:hypothetical protein
MRHPAKLLALLLFAAGAAAAAGVAPPAPAKGWTSEDSMTCGDSRVVVATACIEEDDEPWCASQQLTVTGPGGKRETAYRYSLKDRIQPFITGAACYKKGKEALIILQRTNFGNCRGCEWSDFYTADGRYLGSNDGMNREESLRHKPLSAELRALVARVAGPRSSPTAEIPYISRARPR